MLNLFMSSGNFPPSTKWRKYNIFWWFKFIIWGLWEVEHDLETCQRPRSPQILSLWTSQGPENWKWSFKKYRTFIILFMDENCRNYWTWSYFHLLVKSWTLFESIVINYAYSDTYDKINWKYDDRLTLP